MAQTAIGLVLLAAFLASAWPMWGASAATAEEGSLLEYPVLVLRGLAPYKDFQTVYGPGSEWLLAAFYALFGTSVSVERLVGLGYRLALLTAIYVLARRAGRLTGVLCAVVAWTVLLPFGLMAYSWIGGVAIALSAVAVLASGTDEPTMLRVFVSGLLGGVALLFRPDLALAVAVPSVVLWYRPPFPLRAATWWIAGLVPSAALYVYLLVTSGFSSVVNGLFVDPVIRMEPGRRLPLPPSFHTTSDYFGRVQQFVRGGDAWFGIPLPAQVAVLFWLVIASVVIFAVISLVRRGQGTPTRFAVAIWLLFVCLLPEMLERADVTHLRFVGCVVFALLPVCWIGRGSRTPAGMSHRLALATSASVLVLLISVCPFYITQASFEAITGTRGIDTGIPVRNGSRSLPVGSTTVASELTSVISYIDAHSRTGQRLFVGPTDLRFTNYNELYIYWLLPTLIPATRFLEMNPGLANAPDSGLSTQLRSADWIVLSARYASWNEPNASTTPGSASPNDVIHRNFYLVMSVGPYQVLRADR